MGARVKPAVAKVRGRRDPKGFSDDGDPAALKRLRPLNLTSLGMAYK